MYWQSIVVAIGTNNLSAGMSAQETVIGIKTLVKVGWARSPSSIPNEIARNIFQCAGRAQIRVTSTLSDGGVVTCALDAIVS